MFTFRISSAQNPASRDAKSASKDAKSASSDAKSASKDAKSAKRIWLALLEAGFPFRTRMQCKSGISKGHPLTGQEA